MGKLKAEEVVSGLARAFSGCTSMNALTASKLDDKTSSVVFDAINFDEPGALESAIADALEDAGDSSIYVLVLPADEEVGYVYTSNEDVPDNLDEKDWVVVGKTPSELASAIRAFV